MVPCIPPTASIIFYRTLGMDSLILHIFLAVKQSHLNCYNLCDLTGKKSIISLEAAKANRSVTYHESRNWIEIPVLTTGSFPLSQKMECFRKYLSAPMETHWSSSLSFFHCFTGSIYCGELWYQKAIIIFQ